ncbi:MAG: LLM class flavin-dependent oxidoreductase [Chloroflexi bacterium]|nr:LLM class flavin-dependent oxidoreductase [Chloroflexota bacterium]
MPRNLRFSVLTIPPANPTELAELAEATEAYGYDSLWLADERFHAEPYSALTYCATRTRRIGLGVCVTDPYSRHPALTAMAIATVDALSGGRAILGIGAGGSGFAQLGLHQIKPARALAEAIDLIRRLLRSETVTLDGEVVSFKHGKLDFAPVRADLPVYVASQNQLGLRLAGEVADGAIMQGCVNEAMLRFFDSEVQAGAVRGGRTRQDVDRVARIDVIIDADRRAALDAVRPNVATTLLFQKPKFASFVQAGLDIPASLRELIADIPPSRDREITLPIAQHIPDEWVDSFIIAGDVERVAEQVGNVMRHANHFMLRSIVSAGGHRVDVLRQFAEDVVPRVRQALSQ